MEKIISQKGFTLIELLVVISIISLLATVILGSLGQARENAEWRAFDSEILQIQKAVQLYREENNGDWPLALDHSSSLSELVLQLNSAGLYQGNLNTAPDGTGFSNYPGRKISVGAMSCGGWHTDVYYVIYSDGVNISDKSNVFKDMYYGGSLEEDGNIQSDYSCVEFR